MLAGEFIRSNGEAQTPLKLIRLLKARLGSFTVRGDRFPLDISGEPISDLLIPFTYSSIRSLVKSLVAALICLNLSFLYFLFTRLESLIFDPSLLDLIGSPDKTLFFF